MLNLSINDMVGTLFLHKRHKYAMQYMMQLADLLTLDNMPILFTGTNPGAKFFEVSNTGSL